MNVHELNIVELENRFEMTVAAEAGCDIKVNAPEHPTLNPIGGM